MVEKKLVVFVIVGKLRLRGFAEAGIKDPIAYEKNYNDVMKNHIAYENGE